MTPEAHAALYVQLKGPAVPVTRVPGALWGYCPRCGAPGEFRAKPVDGKWGKDRCQNGHQYPSLEAVARAGGAAPNPPAPAKRRKKI
jgi:hypothetical protein